MIDFVCRPISVTSIREFIQFSFSDQMRGSKVVNCISQAFDDPVSKYKQGLPAIVTD